MEPGVSFATVDLHLFSAGAFEAVESAGAENANGMSVFIKFPVGPMTTAFSFRLKIQEPVRDAADSADRLSLLLRPSSVPT